MSTGSEGRVAVDACCFCEAKLLAISLKVGLWGVEYACAVDFVIKRKVREL